MRLFNYMTEGRSKKISEEAFRKKLPKHSDALENPIYRAIKSSNDKYAFVRPNQFERESAYAEYNFYTLLLDNLLSWKNYPKRSKSVVCGSDLDMISSRYGGRYIVLPKNGSKIGVCPNYDIWFSFHELYIRHIENLDDFNDVLHMIWDNDIPKTYQEMVKQEIIKTGNIENHFSDYDDSENFVADYLNKILDPDDNGFEIIKSGQSMNDGCEVWTEGDCLLYRTERKTRINDLEKLRNML